MWRLPGYPDAQLCSSEAAIRGSQTRQGDAAAGLLPSPHFTDVDTGTQGSPRLPRPSACPSPRRASDSQIPLGPIILPTAAGLRKRGGVWGQRGMTRVTSRPIWLALPTSSSRKLKCCCAGLENWINEANESTSCCLLEPVCRQHEGQCSDQPGGRWAQRCGPAAPPSHPGSAQPTHSPSLGPWGVKTETQEQDQQLSPTPVPSSRYSHWAPPLLGTPHPLPDTLLSGHSAPQHPPIFI